MAKPLVEAIKEFRATCAEKAKSPITLQSVTWDLDPGFVGEPLNGALVTRISEYVDRKLEEYASILGSMAATRAPQAVRNYPGIPSPTNDIPIGDPLAVTIPVEVADEHVCSDPASDAFVRYNVSADSSKTLHDEHVAHGHGMDQFLRINTTDPETEEGPLDALIGPEVQGDEIEDPAHIGDPHDIQIRIDENHVGHGQLKDQFVRSNNTEDSLSENAARYEDVQVGPVVYIEEIRVDDIARTVDACRRAMESAHEEGIPCGLVHEDNTVEGLDVQECESEDGQDVGPSNPINMTIGTPTEQYTGHHVVRVPETQIEAVRIHGGPVTPQIVRAQEAMEQLREDFIPSALMYSDGEVDGLEEPLFEDRPGKRVGLHVQMAPVNDVKEVKLVAGIKPVCASEENGGPPGALLNVPVPRAPGHYTITNTNPTMEEPEDDETAVGPVTPVPAHDVKYALQVLREDGSIGYQTPLEATEGTEVVTPLVKDTATGWPVRELVGERVTRRQEFHGRYEITPTHLNVIEPPPENDKPVTPPAYTDQVHAISGIMEADGTTHPLTDQVRRTYTPPDPPQGWLQGGDQDAVVSTDGAAYESRTRSRDVLLRPVPAEMQQALRDCHVETTIRLPQHYEHGYMPSNLAADHVEVTPEPEDVNAGYNVPDKVICTGIGDERSPNRPKDSLVRPIPEQDVQIQLKLGMERAGFPLRPTPPVDNRQFDNSILRTQNLQEVNNDPMRPLKVKPLHVGTNPYTTPWHRGPINNLIDTTSYVTSYDIDHRTLKITARVITAPSTMKIDHEMWFDLCDSDGRRTPRSLKDVVRDTVKANLAIIMKDKRHTEVFDKISESEQTAMDTLREMVTEEEFRRYLKYGFVPIKGKSGDTYQVFRNQSHTRVWHNGKVVEEICIRIRDFQIPPTDNVIAFMTMISANEEEFKKLGNRYKMDKAA